MSSTVTWYCMVVTFPERSVAVHTTTVIPTGNSKLARVEPLFWLLTSEILGQLSVTVGLNSVPTAL